MTHQQKPDLLFVKLIHEALRVDAERLVTATSSLTSAEEGRLADLHAFFDEYRGQLCLHHTHEDNIFFPALQTLVSESSIPIAELATQHGSLDADLQAIEGGLASLAIHQGDFDAALGDVVSSMSRMAEHLDAHLTMEEQTVLPLMASAVPESTYKQLEARARKSTPGREARFLIPWIIDHADHEQRNHLFKKAPPLRVVYIINRRRYRRFDRPLRLTPPDPPHTQHAFD